MVTLTINNQNYDVHEEVAEQFSKFIRRSKTKDEQLAAGAEREEGMCLAISQLQAQLESPDLSAEHALIKLAREYNVPLTHDNWNDVVKAIITKNTGK
jgi:hypothetical protein